MRASTYCFVAGPLPPGPAPAGVPGSVSRVSARPATVSDAEAFATVSPAPVPLMITVHWPLALVEPLPVRPFAAPQVPPVIWLFAPFEFAIAVDTDAPANGWKPLPVPSFALTVTVNVCA